MNSCEPAYSKNHNQNCEKSSDEIINHDAKTVFDEMRRVNMLLMDPDFLKVLVHTANGPWFGGIEKPKD
jgi:hypothetical protein